MPNQLLNSESMLVTSEIELTQSLVSEELYRSRFDEKTEEQLRNFIVLPFQDGESTRSGATDFGGKYFILWVRHGDRLCGLRNYICSGPDGFSLFTGHHDASKYPSGFALSLTSHLNVARMQIDFALLRRGCILYGEHFFKPSRNPGVEGLMHFVMKGK